MIGAFLSFHSDTDPPSVSVRLAPLVRLGGSARPDRTVYVRGGGAGAESPPPGGGDSARPALGWYGRGGRSPGRSTGPALSPAAAPGLGRGRRRPRRRMSPARKSPMRVRSAAISTRGPVASRPATRAPRSAAILQKRPAPQP